MKKIFILLIIIIFSGCSFIEELTHMTPPEIVSFTPDSTTIDAESIAYVRIKFSESMDKTKTENAFSLSEDSEQLNGSFKWSGNELEFIPFSGFRANKEYEIGLTTNSEDVYGNTIADAFSFKFFTGAELIPPSIESTSPVNSEVIPAIWQQIIINFSETVNPETFYSAFSINPDVNGSFVWNAEYSSVTFSPSSNYKQGEEYRVEISIELTDSSGNNLPESYYFYFQAGAELEQGILSVETENSNVILEDTSISTYNTGIAKDESFIIIFLYPVSAEERQGIIQVVPTTTHDIIWAQNFTSCVLSFEDYLEYGAVYELEILDSIYRIRIDHTNSIPPEIKMIAYCDDEALNNTVELELNDTISIIAENDEYFDFYIQHSRGNPIDISSFFDALNIAPTNSCLDINYISFEIYLDITEPPGFIALPPPLPNTEIQIIRLYCDITNPGNSGIVTISIDTDLKDTNDNYMKEEFNLIILK